MSIGDAIQNMWTGLLHITSLFVIPDWGALINLLPVFLVLGVVAPLLTLGLLVWLIYFVRKPRVAMAQPAGPAPAQLDAGGKPMFPRGEPFCYRDGLIYPPNTTRCEICRDDLAVRCPKCDVTRPASVDTCGNCGLVLKVRPQALVPHRARPPKGGAAAA